MISKQKSQNKGVKKTGRQLRSNKRAQAHQQDLAIFDEMYEEFKRQNPQDQIQSMIIEENELEQSDMEYGVEMYTDPQGAAHYFQTITSSKCTAQPALSAQEQEQAIIGMLALESHVKSEDQVKPCLDSGVKTTSVKLNQKDDEHVDFLTDWKQMYEDESREGFKLSMENRRLWDSLRLCELMIPFVPPQVLIDYQSTVKLRSLYQPDDYL